VVTECDGEREWGPIEAGVRRDLDRLTPAIKESALAAVALQLARELDGTAPEDDQLLDGPKVWLDAAKELRAVLVELNATKPLAKDAEGDGVDQLAARRASRRGA
jgi:hypothetical protein